MKIRNLVIGTIAVSLIGCAGRSPEPVAVIQPQDRFMDCPAIQTEVLVNNAKVQGLASESGGKVAQNVAAGVAGLFIWPLWFAMDFQGATDKETTALNSRQQYLTVLAEQRRCGEALASPARSPLATPAVAQAAPVSIMAVAGPPACRQETLSYCASVTPGDGRIVACLREHSVNLSSPCAAAVTKLSLQR
jgi:hypothetical protein